MTMFGGEQVKTDQTGGGDQGPLGGLGLKRLNLFGNRVGDGADLAGMLVDGNVVLTATGAFLK